MKIKPAVLAAALVLCLLSAVAALAADPAVQELRVTGAKQLKAQQYDDAIATFTRLIELDPAGPTAYFHRGLAYKYKSDLTPAIADFTAAIGLSPQYFLALRERGHAYFLAQEFDLAIADLTAAIELEPAYVPAYIVRASIYADRNQFDLALADQDKIVALAPTAESYLNRAILRHFTSERTDLSLGALADLDQAIRLDPKNLTAYHFRAHIKNLLKKYPQAIDDYTTILAMKPANVTALVNRGNAYGLLGRYAEAIADAQKAIRLHPQNFMAHFNLAQAYELTGRQNEALQEYRTADGLLLPNPAVYVPERKKVKARLSGDWDSLKEWL